MGLKLVNSINWGLNFPTSRENYIRSIWKSRGDRELYSLNLVIWWQLRTISAQFGNLEATENYIRLIKKYEGGRELYPFNLVIWWMTENYIHSIQKFGGGWELYLLNLKIWRRLRTISAQSGNLEATENYIHSIWWMTKNYIRSIQKFGGDWELYPLNLVIWRKSRTISAQSGGWLGTVSAKSENLGATKNYIRSIWWMTENYIRSIWWMTKNCIH